MLHDNCLSKLFAVDDLYATVARWLCLTPVGYPVT